MPIQLAFSTVACPEWSITQVAQAAREMGYIGVELRTLGPAGKGLASDPQAAGAEAVREALKAEGMAAVSLATSIALHYGSTEEAKQAMAQAQAAITLAAKIGAPWVRLYGYQIEAGCTRGDGLARIAERAAFLADRAKQEGVGILLENAGSLSRAKDWWAVMDLLESHANVGMSWNHVNAILAGEAPGVSIPMLHQRIKLAKLKDVQVAEEKAQFVKLGEGQAQAKEVVYRLMGIGFAGPVVVEWDRLWVPALEPAETYLKDAKAKVDGWLADLAKAQEAAKPKPKPKAVKK